MDNYKTIFSREIPISEIGEKVCVTGIISKRWSNKQRFGFKIKDITGEVNISLSDRINYYDKNLFQIGKRVRVYAMVMLDQREQLCLKKVEKIEFLEEINQLNQELDILEQESLVAISKICNKIRTFLGEKKYLEINTRIISRYLGEEILEPLLAHYPGYGSSAFLTPSPSSQLSEFLAVTLLPKVFTETVSISSTYRFRNGSTEMPIIMAKAINLSVQEEKDIILKLSSNIVDSISGRKFKLKSVEGEWNDELVIENNHEDGIFVYGTYTSNIPTVGRKWNSVVHTIRRLEDDKGNLLVESATETINEHTDITTITFYPTQYLNWISRAPKRQLLNLWKVYDGGNMYGG